MLATFSPLEGAHTSEYAIETTSVAARSYSRWQTHQTTTGNDSNQSCAAYSLPLDFLELGSYELVNNIRKRSGDAPARIMFFKFA